MGVAGRILLLVLVLWAGVAHADIVGAPGAGLQNTPTMNVAPNGVEVVDIVGPNGAGVSHNMYSQFDVPIVGAVLNNSTQAVNTNTLAGAIVGNANLNGRSATLIINEVFSSNPSLLSGFLEVVGSGADVVISNPNGITCRGCGFINTPRASLTTGVPRLDSSSGELISLDVDKGKILIEGTGLSSPDYVDIISRAVDVSGQLNAKDVKVYLGRNTLNYVTKELSKKAHDGSVKPELALDGSALGAMYANSIAIIVTEDGVGVKTPKMKSGAGDIVIRADGAIEVVETTSTGKTIITSNSSKVKVLDEVLSADAIEINGATSIDLLEGAAVKSMSDVTLSAKEVNGKEALIAAGSADASGVNNPAKLNILTDKLNLAKSLMFTSNGGAIDTFSGAKTVVNAGSSAVYSWSDFSIAGKSFEQYMTDYEYHKAVQVGEPEMWQVGMPVNEQTYYKYQKTTYQDSFTGLDSAPLMFVKGKLTLDLDNFSNWLGHVYVDGVLDLKNTSIDNQNLNLYKTFDETKTTYTYEKTKDRTLFHSPEYGYVGRSLQVDVPSELINTVYSTIYVTGSITGTNADQIINAAANKDMKQVEGDFKSDPNVAKFMTQLDFVNSALYKKNPDPTATYLYETRANFVDVSKLVNSSAFLAKFPPPNNVAVKLLGDAYVEQESIRKQLLNDAGLMTIEGYANTNDLVTGLFSNAEDFATSSNVPTGTKLTQAQANSLTKDMLWMEFEEIDGRTVLAPKLYLASTTKATLAKDGAVIKGGSVSLAAKYLENSGSILSDTTLDIASKNTTNSGVIAGAGAVTVAATETVHNISGQISGDTTKVTGKNVINETAVTRETNAHGYNDVLGRKAEITGVTKTEVSAGEDLVNRGAKISSENDTSVTAGRDVYNVSAVQESSSSHSSKYTNTSSYMSKNEASEISGKNVTTVDATTGYVYNTGSEINGKTGHVKAGKQVVSEHSTDVEVSSRDTKSGGLWSKKTSNQSSERGVVNKSTIEFKDGYTLRSGDGDTILQGTDVKSNGPGVHENPNGTTVYKVAKNYESSSLTQRGKNLIRFKNIDSGKYNEHIVHGNVDVSGGITYQGTSAPVVEYHDKGDLGTSMAALATSPQTAWISNIAANPMGANLVGVKEGNSSYYNKQSGFTREFATLAGVAVTIASAGTASEFGAAIAAGAGAQGTAAVAVQQGATALASAAAGNATTNTFLQNGNLGKGLKTTFSGAGLKSLAATAVTAGATGGLSSELGIGLDAKTLRPVSATDALDRAKYAAVSAATKTAADVAILCKPAGEALLDNLRNNAGTQMQAAGASHLGHAYQNQELSYLEHKLAHAGLGGGGAIVSGNDSGSAALGAAVAEYTGEAAFLAGFRPENAADLGKIAGSTTGLLTGDVGSASESAITAIDNNFLPMAIGAGMLAEAYLISQVDEGGDIGQALEKVGQGNDTLSKFTEAAILRGVEISYEKYPSQTRAVLETLGDAGDAVGVAVSYVDDKTGKVVSANWNSLSKTTQDKLKGGMGLIGMTVTGATAGSVVKSFASSAKIAKIIAPNEVPNKLVKVGWSKGNMPQGMPWEDFVGTKLAEGTRLPAGFKTFDYFDRTSGIATSAKTLDTMTPSKIKNPEQIYSTLKRYVDKTAGFTRDVRSIVDVTTDMIKTRRIELAVPSGTNADQYKHIQKAIEYAKSHNVELNVTRVK